MTVTSLSAYRSRDTINALRSLLSMAERGELSGVVASGITQAGDYRVVLAGKCHDSPALALKAAMRMSWAVTQRQDEIAGPPPPQKLKRL